MQGRREGEKTVNLMDRRVHGIGADRAFEQLVDAGGRSNGGCTRDSSIVDAIAPRLGRRKFRKLLMWMWMWMWVKGIMGLTDLILVEII